MSGSFDDVLPSDRVDPERAYYPGCGSNSCLVFKPLGVGTNGPCSCHSEPDKAKRAIQVLWNKLQASRKNV